MPQTAHKPKPVDAAKPLNDSVEPRRAGEPRFNLDLLDLSRLAIIVMGVIVGVTGLKYGRSIIMPVLGALILAITMRPLQRYGRKLYLPDAVTALIIIAGFGGLLFLGVTLLSAPVGDWVANSGDISTKIKQKLSSLDAPLETFRELSKALGGGGPAVSLETGFATFAQQALGILSPAVTEFIVFFGTLVFFLVGNETLRKRTIKAMSSREDRLSVMRVWNDMEEALVRYLGTVTMINIGLGIASGLMLWAIGFPSPLAFGVLIFCLNYIPYLGPAIFAIVLTGVGIVAFPTIGGALLAPALFVAIATVEGHFITPSIIGHRLTLSPFLVFLSVAFWTWLWGPFGTFLATPLLIVMMVMTEHLRSSGEKSLP
ncbi:AI-2 transport protein TqsA [Variibacter gotjawalensis]|uniref:AI-2 transport protein TqsA n=1 Tax=Variibacter gotjawalensis TaxID=1333996 RepID=A0A0S3PVE2_9BRAD|nr:AI-2E family transporter [Variibacter gotjawalensis]NIK50133.1 putative PurR-regulated permease PerM [Variibacter gotjawalensis]RZS46130.1 putative PurR-regulated permease PerM [Variibacter gotjawalensis]BAT59806.1 AI-2 transport protein TqsA [Variibacter gotjawalensis]